MSNDSTDKVLSIVASIKNQNSNTPTESIEEEVTVKSGVKKDVIAGKPKSGRFWKSKRERFSSVVKTKGIKPDFQAKTALRLELKRTKDLSKQALEQINQKKLAQKERRRENIKKTEENKRKSEVVQVITNTAKLKRMRKKQLRFIQKRDTNKEVEAAK
ncbi:unnamed protein product [Plutella xylostella]|uniref:Coiled-coil domain-containing protein 86 n=1 Tax=Plutella xylostella TaxID=51655 RepID=A0A8S4DTA9_PLUXY|nr:unnamed protein product [Plutella xylostella]